MKTSSPKATTLLASLGLAGFSWAGFGCASEDPLPTAEGCCWNCVSSAVSTGVYAPVAVPGSQCGAVITQEDAAGGLHVEECSRITYASNPPSSGEHFSSWAAFKTYPEPVPRGFWVHSLEHGAVAILHDCRNCSEEIEAAGDMIDALPEEPGCAAQGVPRRVLMTPDPLLDVPWAAAAWTFTLRSRCFEAEIFRNFVIEHIGRGPENICADGRD